MAAPLLFEVLLELGDTLPRLIVHDDAVVREGIQQQRASGAALRVRRVPHGHLPTPLEVYDLREERALGSIDLAAGAQQRLQTRVVECDYEAEIDACLLCRMFQLVAGFRVLPFEQHASDAREHARHLGDHAEDVVLAFHPAKSSALPHALQALRDQRSLACYDAARTR